MRLLAVDTVQQANSGRPGTPMRAALLAYVLRDRFLTHNQTHPEWPDRDRFILSPGRASAPAGVLCREFGTGRRMAEEASRLVTRSTA